jgi:soluble lytic murein transglycosylase-like protein
MTKTELIALARTTANSHTLDPSLVCAIVEQESGWNPWALRYEPTFFTRYVAPLVEAQNLSTTESNARATSWGLMQVMGQVAREHSFVGRSLAELCDPATGLVTGCQILSSKLSAARGNVDQALLLWNGGSNEAYPNEVLARIGSYQP